MSLSGIEKLSTRFFSELEDETPNGPSIPTLDDYGLALDEIHQREDAERRRLEAIAADAKAHEEYQARTQEILKRQEEAGGISRLTVNDVEVPPSSLGQVLDGVNEQKRLAVAEAERILSEDSKPWVPPSWPSSPLVTSTPYQRNGWASASTCGNDVNDDDWIQCGTAGGQLVQDITNGYGRRRRQWGTG